MLITVTRQDIKEGSPGNPTNCAIARAVKRQLPQGSGVSIASTVEVWMPDGFPRHYILPGDSADFISLYDLNTVVRSFLRSHQLTLDGLEDQIEEYHVRQTQQLLATEPRARRSLAPLAAAVPLLLAAFTFLVARLS